MLCTFKFAQRSGIYAATVLCVAFLIQTSPTLAQSTGTQEVEDILVVAKKRDDAIGGIINAEQVSKTRSSVNQEFLETQLAGQSIAQSLSLLPGVNFTNNDPYGSSGGNFRIRSFDNNRIFLSLDGMPLNDSGNYAIFTNQQIDPEVIARTTVNLGTSDVDAPTAAATGGTINIITRNPEDHSGLIAQTSIGSFDYRRFFARLDTGANPEWGTAAFLTASWQKYDKFKGFGTLEKKQVNAKVYQPIGQGDDFISVAFHYNKNRNNFYRNPTLPELAFFGYEFDNLPVCTRDAPSPGVADNDNSNGSGAGAFLAANNNPDNPSSCTNYYNLRINPSNTGNIHAQSSFGLTDQLRLTVDPSFQYVLANGGGNAAVTETDLRLRGNGGAGRDLNGDGDLLDTVRVYSPSITNTRRYGVNTSLIWTLAPDHVVRAAYALDYALHRQSGEMGPVDALGNPLDVFAGLKGPNILVSDGSGQDLRARDRKSIAKLNQASVSYSGGFFDNTLRVDVGVRLPFFFRELNQFCYTAVTSAGATSFPGSAQSAICTTQPVASVLPNGNVTLVGAGANEYKPPFKGEKRFDDVLPNAGLSYKPFGDEHMFYASYAAGLSVPRTDNLYSVQILDVQPETTRAYDVGYRFQSDNVLASAALWKTYFKNRIVTSFDQELNLNVDRNIGDVKLWGVDAEIGVEPLEGLSLYGSASYINSEVQGNIQIAAGIVAPTKGKKLVETPDWTFSGRIQYEIAHFTVGVQGKYVGERFATDLNDEAAPSYVTFDANLQYALDALGFEGTFIQANVVNIADKQYLGSISSTFTNTGLNATPLPTYAIGAPRTYQLTLRAAF